ncbi:MAG: class I SAM-dependent methyltransferase, partial [Clostridiales bacterium]|nr:class I SAM-dependent methyltransferase [Clostridiales bacterium]
MRDWEVYQPVFECDQYNEALLFASPWSGHRNFAYDLTIWKAPERIVELGSFYGCSAFAFLQAIKDRKMDTEFYGVDLWAKSDAYTLDDYKEDVFGAYQSVNQKCFSGQKSYRLKMTFDDALQNFEDHSIDILHIDGSHFYDCVKHDYTTWKNKVRKNGIVLFHDISEDEIYGEVMGTHYFWTELKKEEPCTYEFDFSFGLGILFFDKEEYQKFKESVSEHYYQQINNHLSLKYKEWIREDYFKLRDRDLYIDSLNRQLETKEEHLGRYREDEKKKDLYIAELKMQGEELNENLNGKNRYIAELETQRRKLNENL